MLHTERCDGMRWDEATLFKYREISPEDSDASSPVWGPGDVCPWGVSYESGYPSAHPLSLTPFRAGVKHLVLPSL